jgi:predicted PurR-regulated permease PerM
MSSIVGPAASLPAAPEPAAPHPASEEAAAAAPRRERQYLTRGIWALVYLAAGYTVWAAASLLFPILFAVMMSLLLAPVVGVLARMRVPEPLGAALVVVALLGGVILLAMHLYAPVERWVSAGPAEVREMQRKLRVLRQPVEAVKEAGDKVAAMTGDAKAKPPAVAIERTDSLAMVRTAQSVFFTALTTLMLIYFLLASGDLFLRKLVRIIPRFRDKIRAVEISRQVKREIGQYFVTTTLINAGLGVATGLAMWLLGMPTPALWGVAVALLNFIPYIGPAIGVAILGVVAVLTFDPGIAMVAPPLVYLVLHFIEGQIIGPLVFGQRLAMNPVVIFVWVLVWAWLWGIGGIVLAVPLLVAVRIFASHVPSAAPLAQFLARD